MPVLCLHLHFLSSASALVPLLQMFKSRRSCRFCPGGCSVFPAQEDAGWAALWALSQNLPSPPSHHPPRDHGPVWVGRDPLPALSRAHHAHSAAQASSLPAGAASVTTDCPNVPHPRAAPVPPPPAPGPAGPAAPRLTLRARAPHSVERGKPG